MPQLSRADLENIMSNDTSDVAVFLRNILDSTANIITDKPVLTAGTNATSLVYKAIVTQSGTGAPSETVLQNTIGLTPSWSRLGRGVFTLTATGKFTANKTLVQLTEVNPTPDDVGMFVELGEDMPNEIYVKHINDSFIFDDNCTFCISIEIFP